VRPPAEPNSSPAGGRATPKGSDRPTPRVGGREALGVDAWARRLFQTAGVHREVIGDPHARYFGTELKDGELTPGEGARIGAIDFETWWAGQMDTQR
jgi:hypothetical protein